MVFLCLIFVIGVFIILILAINILQRKLPRVLPKKLQSWEFLPRWLRSLEPYDQFFHTLHEISWCGVDQFELIDSSVESGTTLLLEKSKLYDLNKIQANKNVSSSSSES